LGKDAAAAMTALTLNGMRLVVGAVILAFIGIALGIRLRPSGQHLWRYAVIGPLNMAIPQGLLFMGLRSYDARPIDAAITEAAIPGLILVYLFASRRRVTWEVLVTAATVLLGLAVFLGLHNGMMLEPDQMTMGSWLLLSAAMLTSVGLICDDRMTWPEEPAVQREWRWKMVHKTQVTKSLRKTLFGSLISGIGTLLLIPILNLLLADHATQVLTAPPSAWPGVVMLALVGTCVTWFSIFLLIQMKQMVLIVALVAGIPVVSAAYDTLSSRTELVLQGHEWFGGGLLVVSLLALVYMQLIRPDMTSPPPAENIHHAPPARRFSPLRTKA
jgi:drug/metabolite transporter (DMT)-like permease